MNFKGRFAIVIAVLLLMALPLGTIFMGIACKGDGKIDGWDWIFSLAVPFYGPLVALIHCM